MKDQWFYSGLGIASFAATFSIVVSCAQSPQDEKVAAKAAAAEAKKQAIEEKKNEDACLHDVKLVAVAPDGTKLWYYGTRRDCHFGEAYFSTRGTQYHEYRHNVQVPSTY